MTQASPSQRGYQCQVANHHVREDQTHVVIHPKGEHQADVASQPIGFSTNKSQRAIHANLVHSM